VFSLRFFSIYLFCLLCTTGCAGKKPRRVVTPFVDYQEIVAKFADLPDAPFQAQLKNIVICPTNHDQVQIFYTTTMASDELVLLYEQQMERLGWQLLSDTTIHDQVLIYTKPNQVCTIIFSGSSLSVYLSSKKGA